MHTLISCFYFMLQFITVHFIFIIEMISSPLRAHINSSSCYRNDFIFHLKARPTNPDKTNNAILLSICSLLFLFMKTTNSLDSIAPGEVFRYGDKLVSASSTFELGFFRPGNSKRLYVGIWYKISPSTVVWVANREVPLNNSSGVLHVNDQGVLVLLDGTNNTIWSSNTSTKADNPIAQLLDLGNLVVRNGRDNSEGIILWQSFDYPCDTILPGMKLGWNLVTGLDRYVSSWKSADDPGEGDVRVKIDIRGYPQAVQLKGNVITARAGYWNGVSFTGFPTENPHSIYKHEFVFNEREVYYRYELQNRSIFSRFVYSNSGVGQRFVWTSQTSSWEVIVTTQRDRCENYALCGANTVCNINNTPVCGCLKSFVPKNQEEWNVSYWSNGCVRSIPLDCSDNHGFMKYPGLKMPDTSSSWYNKTMDLAGCQESCLRNCSCTAYANLDIRDGGSGCLLWFDGLIDIKQFSPGGQDLYIQVPASELDHAANNGHHKITKKMLVGIAVGSAILVLGLIILGCTFMMKKRVDSSVAARIFPWKQYRNRPGNEDTELPIFDFAVITKATNNFSSIYKLGQGGFGPVYKGTLIDGKEVAIKRNSKMSDQGLEEFKNEVALIAKLQHRNLVKLLGCCIHGEEKLLIYEYMPNKSLDYFIFDESGSKNLDWLQRFRIIDGVARGILYLHQDSRLRVIHRDLKTSNILLDSHMNPKISDFGLARTFGLDQMEGSTKKVVGTYGYMPPEYAVHGHYSDKSDIFSFGVILLEIVTGKKNRSFFDPEQSLNLLGHAWRLWTEDRQLELIDRQLSQSCKIFEVKRCIQVGLLCVQQKPEDRPSISSVILMLNGEKLLPRPKAPGFYTGSDNPEVKSCSRIEDLFSRNDMSLSIFEAR